MGWLRGLAVVVLAVALSGCVSNNFSTNADLSRAAPRATPLQVGAYVTDGDEFAELTLDRNGTYALTVQSDDGEQSITASFFGPVAGLYVMQAEGIESGGPRYQNIVAKVEGGRLLLADDGPVATALGNLSTTRSGSAQTPLLAGDAASNWATITTLLEKFGNRFTWGLELTRKSQ